MARSAEKTKSALPYVQRLFEDEYVQEQLRDAAGGLRSAYERVRSRGGTAAEDKRLYASVREAATSMRRAAQPSRSASADRSHRRAGPARSRASLGSAATAFAADQRIPIASSSAAAKSSCRPATRSPLGSGDAGR
jgi:hypothetical protein